MTENGRSRGFGFVCFSRISDAERAIRSLSGLKTSFGKGLYVAKAQLKEDRRRMLESKRREKLEDQAWDGSLVPVIGSPVQVTRSSLQITLASRTHKES